MATNLLKTATGKFGVFVGTCLLSAGLWVGLGGSMWAAPAPPDPTTCLPTCEVDGRMLVVAGDDPTTLAAQEIILGLRFTVAAGPNANFQLYDGDRDATNWDVRWNDGTPAADPDAPKLVLEIYADPAGIGGSGPALATFTPGGIPGIVEKGEWPTTNNAWQGLEFFHAPEAQNGNFYQYALHIRPFNPAVDRGWNAFKIRANGTVLLLGNQVVGFLGALNIPNDIPTIYPNYPANLDSPYDGTWTFQTLLPPFLNDVTVFDGDMDFGAEDCSYNDTDDPDSSGVPSFATGTAAVNEGVAQATGLPSVTDCTAPGSGIRTGLPADDNTGLAWYRSPSPVVPNGIAYQLKAPSSAGYPSGQIFLNQNVSGNKEWEQFKIQLVAPGDAPSGPCPAGGYPADIAKGYPASDCRTDEMPGGVWEIQLFGMDMSNLNFWYFNFEVQEPPEDYSIGRLVWYDANKNGVQDMCGATPCPEEPGIPNVTYTVYDGPLPGGNAVRTGITNSEGEFLEILLPAANYTVVVDATNFGAGQPLEGLASTTGGETENGIEVGLPVCIDTNNPVGCGDPVYAEAIFGYVEEVAAAVLIIDEDTIDEDKASIKAISNGPPYCGGPVGGPGSPKVCINEDIADVGERTPLFTRPRDVTPISNMMLPTGRVADEGLFMFTLPDPQMSAQNGATFTLSQFFFGTGAVANENNLDKIKGVRPLTAADIYALEGKAVCAVVYDSDINWDYKKVQANLKGATLGVTAFTVTDVTPHPSGGSYLPNITFDLLPIAAHATVCDVSGG